MTHKKIFLGIPALSTIGLCSALMAAPASAFTFNGGNVGITAADIGKSFNVVFDGNINGNIVPGLSSLATITFLGFQASGSNTLANLQISLTNTSGGSITSSRTSALGFNVDPNAISASVTSGGLFANAVLNRQFPNNAATIDICFINNRNNCGGGSSGGVTNGTTGTFSPTLTFAGSVNSFTLNNFGVRYQSIYGTFTGSNGRTITLNDASGTGSGTPLPPPPPPPPPPPKKVPEPGFVGALALTGVAALRYRKRRQEASIA
jgi:hypothetical protein